MAKVTFKNANKSGAYTYTLSGTDKELADYKKAKGVNYREENGVPLYFTSRPLSSEVEYSLDGAGYLVAPMSNSGQAIINKLAEVSQFSLNDLQKYAAMKAAGLI